ncbi:hypothetical protein GCM10020216_104120 [Nonomuraea helvata]
MAPSFRRDAWIHHPICRRLIGVSGEFGGVRVFNQRIISSGREMRPAGAAAAAR